MTFSMDRKLSSHDKPYLGLLSSASFKPIFACRPGAAKNRKKSGSFSSISDLGKNSIFKRDFLDTFL